VRNTITNHLATDRLSGSDDASEWARVLGQRRSIFG
jgi:hypothetical protein